MAAPAQGEKAALSPPGKLPHFLSGLIPVSVSEKEEVEGEEDQLFFTFIDLLP